MRLTPILLLALSSCSVLSACGQAQDLRPAVGESLPPPPFGRTDPPSAEELLTVDPQAAPERNVELRRRSEEREDDPFDIPPPEG